MRLLGLTLLMAGAMHAQEPADPKPLPTQEPSAAQPSGPAPQPNSVPPPPHARHGKVPYSGPTRVEEMAPTPMLDEEGKQRLDPEGKPMMNPGVRQQRDKYGHPLFDVHGRPVFQTAGDLGFDEKGHKLHGKKEKPPKTISMEVVKGTLTVDGMIGKAALNYDIHDFRYIYLYAPWIGTVVVSNVAFPGSKEQKDAFDQHTLTVNVEDHQFQVFSEKLLLGKKQEPAYVAVDRDFKLPTSNPVMGYGATLKAPYQWPGAKENPESKALVKAPPVPVSLRPTALLPPCPAGQMRARAGVLLPGQTTPPAACVPIATGSVSSPAPATPAPPQ